VNHQQWLLQKRPLTTACVLTDKLLSFHLEVRSIILGYKDIQDSYRAKLGGLYSALIIVHLLQTIHCLPPVTIKLCDRLQAILNAFDSRPLDLSQLQYNLLTCIYHQIQHSPTMVWQPRHVEGNTKLIRGHILDWWEEQNEEMDVTAK
jgi:hypothetical protein